MKALTEGDLFELTMEALFHLFIELENRGQEFYQLAAQMAQRATERQLLQQLATEEQEHAHLLQTILKGQNGKYMTKQQFSLEESNYIRMLLHAHVFPDREGFTTKIATIKSILGYFNVALQAEKDSLLLYDAVLDYAEDEKLRRILENIKNEEKTHLRSIQQQIDNILYR